MAPTKNELIDSAQKFIQKGQLDKAIRDYQQVLQLDSGDIQTRLRLGDLYVKKGNKAEAIQQYLRVAEKHAAAGFYLKAIAVHKQILKLDPGFIESSAQLADLYHKQGLLSDALTQYQVVAAHYDKQGDVRDALDTLTKMADLDPQNVGIRLKLADLYLKAKIKESGIEQLLRAAELLGQAGKAAEQRTVLERIAAAQPANPGANRTLITLLLRAGHVAPALARLSALVAKSPDDAELRELEAEAFVKAGEPTRAQEAYRGLLEYHPDRLAVRACLIGLLLDAGDLAAVEAELAALGPDRLEAGQLDEAASILKTLGERQPEPPPETLAVIQEQLAALYAARDGGLAAAGKSAGARPAVRPPAAPAPAASAAELTIDIDGGPLDVPIDAPAEPAVTGEARGFGEIALGDAQPLEGGVLDGGALDGGMLDAAQAVDAGFVPTVDAGPAPAPASAVEAGAFDLVLDIEAGQEPARAAAAAPAGLLTGESFDLSLDLGAFEAAGGLPAGDAAPLDAPAGAAVARSPASPEAAIIARREPELALDQIPEELEEAEFFVQQGLTDAARAIYRKILAVDPEHPQALARLAALTGAGAAARTGSAPTGRPSPAARPVSPATPVAPARAAAPRGLPDETDAGSFDLAAVLSDTSPDAGGGLLFDPEEQVSFGEVFREFKKGVEGQVGDDAETRYNLGIAYKEMGLIDDAIAEFERALADPRRTFDCYTMLGLSHLARGDAESAIAAFQRGLDHGVLDPSQWNALTYELGLAFEAAGRLVEARAAFGAVASADPAYRDVAAKLDALGQAAPVDAFDPHSLLGPGLAAAAAPSRPAAPKRDKISFV